MKAEETALAGVVLLRGEPETDARGSFLRLWEHATEPPMYAAASSNPDAFTLRGMHYQRAPFEETKIVRCVKGAIFDVAVDARSQSSTFGRWVGVELDAAEPTSVLIEPGHAHGFLTLVPDTTVEYVIVGAYKPDHAAGLRWDDPAIGILWPAAPLLVSDRDASYELLR